MLRSCSMTLRALLASACVLALPLLSLSQTMELARVQAAHASLRQAQNQDDRLALHSQLQSLWICLLYTSPSPRDKRQSRMPSSA